MATLACLLSDLGNTVIGYDDCKDFKFTEKGLAERGIKIYYDNSFKDLDGYIISASKAFKPDHKEIKRLTDSGYKISPYNEIVGSLTDIFRTISICGTHGKTTTTSMISHIVNNVLGCNYFIGDGRGNANKDNDLFVIESDEFNKHFLAYHPSISICTFIELEHTECYDGLEDIIKTFEKFLNKSKEYVVACGDLENIRKINFEKKVIFYGFNEDNDYVLKNVSVKEDGTYFDIYKDNELLTELMVPVYGKHMALNALGATIICMNLGISLDKIKELFKTFHNAERRFQEEVVGDSIIIDDYAHHPTELKVTLEACKAKYKDKKIVAIFKPNTYSRTKEFPNEFAESLDIADYIYVTNIDSNREKQEEYPNITSMDIINKTKNGKLLLENDISELLNYKGNVYCFMSCASISSLKNNLKNNLK